MRYQNTGKFNIYYTLNYLYSNYVFDNELKKSDLSEDQITKIFIDYIDKHLTPMQSMVYKLKIGYSTGELMNNGEIANYLKKEKDINTNYSKIDLMYKKSRLILRVSENYRELKSMLGLIDSKIISKKQISNKKTIYDLMLSPAVFKILANENVYYVENLENFTYNRIKKLAGNSILKENELLNIIKENNIKLKDLNKDNISDLNLIADLNINYNYTYLRLRRAGIKTIADLINTPTTKLKTIIPNKQHYLDLQEELKKHNLSIKDESEYLNQTINMISKSTQSIALYRIFKKLNIFSIYEIINFTREELLAKGLTEIQLKLLEDVLKKLGLSLKPFANVISKIDNEPEHSM